LSRTPLAKLSRRVFFSAARRFTPLLVAEQDGLRFLVKTTDKRVGPSAFTDLWTERRTLDRAMRLLATLDGDKARPQGTWMVDIGANIGISSITAVSEYGIAGAICFEPTPANQRLLITNAELNQVEDRIRMMPFAISDRRGSVPLEIAPEDSGDSRVRMQDPDAVGKHEFGEHERPVIDVQAETLDALIESGEIDLSEVGFVWIDVQGHEGHVLAGASTLRGSSIPVIAEYWPYGLRRAKGLELFHNVVKESYRYFVNLDEDQNGDDPKRPVSELDDLPGKVGGVGFTDLLLVR
jgi:FkbM family methyltransferase